MLAMADVVDLLEVTHAPERVADYRRAMERGDRFPPIAAVRLGGRFLLADGHKRLSAVRALAEPPGTIPVEIWNVRRWLADQAGQLRRKTRRQLSLLARSCVDPQARVEGTRLIADTVGHWRRIRRSLGLRRQRRREEEGSGARSPVTVGPARAVAGGAIASRETFVRLLAECLPLRRRLIAISATLAVLAAAQLSLTWLVKLWAEGPLRTGDAAAMNRLLVAAAVTTLAMMAALLASRALLESVNQRLVERLRNAAQRRILELEVARLADRPRGELLSRVFNDAGALSGFVRDILKRLVGEGVVIVGAVSMMFWLEPRLALCLFAVLPPIAAILVRIGRLIRGRSALAQQRIGALTAILDEQLQGVTTIKGFAAEHVEAARFAAENARLRAQALRSEWWSAVLVSSVWLLTGLGLVAIVWIGSRQVFAGQISAGALLAFCLYAVQTVEPLRRLSEVHAMLQRALAAAARVFEVIDDPGVEPLAGLAPRTPLRGELRCEGLSFHYRQGVPVLQGIDLRIAPGESIAIVAASGGGKSTLASLLVRFVAPSAGRILLDGQDLRHLALRDLRRAVCVVAQEPFLFGGSLAENLRYGSSAASARSIETVATLVGLDPLVAALPGGLSADLREAGRDLSAGQRQRIALARAVLRDPAVLVLDEATSAIDGDGESQVFRALDDWLGRRTVLLMSHRLATVSRCARVVVLARGRVIGDATPHELARGCSEFRLLFAGQTEPLAETSPPRTIQRA